MFRVGHVGDDPAALKQLVYDQLVRADLILTTGGVSQGDYDIVKAVLPELGATDFASVAMQPGKPQGFGLIGDDRTPIIMLPGNPVSAFVSFEAFVRPVIRKLMGSTPYVRPGLRCAAAHAMSSIKARTQLARGRITTDASGARTVELRRGPRLAPARRPVQGRRPRRAARRHRVRRGGHRARGLAAGPAPMTAPEEPGDGSGGSGLTHLNAAGEARMVDVSDKPVTVRTATAAGPRTAERRLRRRPAVR